MKNKSAAAILFALGHIQDAMQARAKIS